MATLNICGWERGDDTEAYATSGTFSVQSTTKRTGTYALQCNPAGSAAGYHGIGKLSATGTAIALARTAETFYTFYFRLSSLPAGTVSFSEVRADGAPGTLIVSLKCTSAGVVTLVGSTTSGTIATVSAGQWYRVDLRVTSNGTSGAKIDGGTEQTCTATNNTQGKLVLGRGVTSETDALNCFYDDVCLDDASSPGQGEVRQLLSTGDGNYTGWVTGTGTTEAEIDDVPHDTDTTYIAVPATGDNTARTFAMENTATVGITGTIKCVKACSIDRSESISGSSSVGVRLRSNTTDSDTTAREWGTVYGLDAKLLDTDPNGGGAWTSSGVDGIEAGVYAGTIAQAQRCTAVSVMVWCAGVPAGDITGSAAMAFGAGSSTLTGAGALAGSATLTFAEGSSTLTGAGALVGSLALIFGEGSSTLIGTNAIAGSADMVFGGSGTLLGDGALAGSVEITFGAGTSTLTGAGALAGSLTITFGEGASTLSGAGALVGSVALVFGEGTSTLLGAGALAGISAITFSLSGTLTDLSGGPGPITGTAAMSFGEGSSSLTGAGALAGTIAVTFGAGSSNLTGSGALAGTSQITFGSGSSSLTGNGALAGAVAMALSATGTLESFIVSIDCDLRGTVRIAQYLGGYVDLSEAFGGTLHLARDQEGAVDL